MLSGRQKIFIQEYLVDLNASKAARIAGYAAPERYCSYLMTLPDIKAEIQKEMDARAERLRIKADDVVRDIVAIATDDISNYLEFKNVEYSVKDVVTDEIVILNKIDVRIKDSTKINTKNIKKVEIGKDGQFKFELYDKQTSQEQLMKHLGAYQKDKPLPDNNIINIGYNFDND